MNCFLHGMISEEIMLFPNMSISCVSQSKKVLLKSQAANKFYFKHQFRLVSSHYLKHCVEKNSEENASCLSSKECYDQSVMTAVNVGGKSS